MSPVLLLLTLWIAIDVAFVGMVSVMVRHASHKREVSQGTLRLVWPDGSSSADPRG